MAKRARINPHDRGTAEHVLFASYRRHSLEAQAQQAQADLHTARAAASRAAAASYAAALDAIGHPVEAAQKLIEGPK